MNNVLIKNYSVDEFLAEAEKPVNQDLFGDGNDDGKIKYLYRDSIEDFSYRVITAQTSHDEIVGFSRVEIVNQNDELLFKYGEDTPLKMQPGKKYFCPRSTSVMPEYQKRGIAKSFLRECFSMAADANYGILIGTLTHDGKKLMKVIPGLQKEFENVTTYFSEYDVEITAQDTLLSIKNKLRFNWD